MAITFWGYPLNSTRSVCLAFGLSHKSHSIFLRLVPSLTIGTSLCYHVFFIFVHGNTDKTFFTRYVSPFSVSVNKTSRWLCPLAKTSVFTFFINFTSISTIEYSIEHNFWVVTICIGSSTKTFCIW